MSENPQGSAPGNPPSDPGAGGPPSPPPSFGAPPPPAPSYEPPPAPPAYPAAPPTYGTPPAAPPTYGTPPTAPPTGAVPYAAPPGAPSYATAPGGVSPSDERMWAIFAHLGPFIIGFLAPLIIFLVYKDRSEYIRDQSAEALNWQITLTIAAVVGFVLIIVLVGFVILLAVSVAGIVFGILAAIAANRGERYRYPWALRLVK